MSSGILEILAERNALLDERDALTARVRALEAQVRQDHAPRMEYSVSWTQEACGVLCGEVYPCAVLTTLGLAPATGEETG